MLPLLRIRQAVVGLPLDAGLEATGRADAFKFREESNTSVYPDVQVVSVSVLFLLFFITHTGSHVVSWFLLGGVGV
jgi:hypothetical protein